MTDPLTRVPGIWRPFLAVSFNGVPGRLYPANPGPGLNWHADAGPGYIAGAGRFFAESYCVEHGELLTILLDDLTGATTGCLAAFCRGLYGLPRMFTVPVGDSDQWVVLDGTRIVAQGPTEPAAWRAAILAHPSLAGLR